MLLFKHFWKKHQSVKSAYFFYPYIFFVILLAPLSICITKAILYVYLLKGEDHVCFLEGICPTEVPSKLGWWNLYYILLILYKEMARKIIKTGQGSLTFCLMTFALNEIIFPTLIFQLLEMSWVSPQPQAFWESSPQEGVECLPSDQPKWSFPFLIALCTLWAGQLSWACQL